MCFNQVSQMGGRIADCSRFTPSGRWFGYWRSPRFISHGNLISLCCRDELTAVLSNKRTVHKINYIDQTHVVLQDSATKKFNSLKAFLRIPD